MKKLLLLLLLVVATGGAFAQTGYVRSQALLMAMPESAAANKKLSEMKSSLERKIQKADQNAQEKLKSMQYKAQDPSMDDAMKMALENEFKTLTNELQSLKMDSERKFAEEEAKLMEPISKRLSDAIQKIAKQRGLKIVVDANSVVFAEDGLDISLDVSKELGIAPKE
ncbi:MAG: OmpH family outer membrane protein [Nonlabens sp.]